MCFCLHAVFLGSSRFITWWAPESAGAFWTAGTGSAFTARGPAHAAFATRTGATAHEFPEPFTSFLHFIQAHFAVAIFVDAFELAIDFLGCELPILSSIHRAVVVLVHLLEPLLG